MTAAEIRERLDLHGHEAPVWRGILAQAFRAPAHLPVPRGARLSEHGMGRDGQPAALLEPAQELPHILRQARAVRMAVPLLMKAEVGEVRRLPDL